MVQHSFQPYHMWLWGSSCRTCYHVLSRQMHSIMICNKNKFHCLRGFFHESTCTKRKYVVVVVNKNHMLITDEFKCPSTQNWFCFKYTYPPAIIKEHNSIVVKACYVAIGHACGKQLSQLQHSQVASVDNPQSGRSHILNACWGRSDSCIEKVHKNLK